MADNNNINGGALAQKGGEVQVIQKAAVTCACVPGVMCWKHVHGELRIRAQEVMVEEELNDRSPSATAQVLRDRYGISIHRNTVSSLLGSERNLAPVVRTVRANSIRLGGRVPISSAVVRLQRLERMYRIAMQYEEPDLEAARACIESARKEAVGAGVDDSASGAAAVLKELATLVKALHTEDARIAYLDGLERLKIGAGTGDVEDAARAASDNPFPVEPAG